MEHERDLAHEADMRQLRREQLRAEDFDGDDEEPLDDPEWADQASIDAGDWD